MRQALLLFTFAFTPLLLAGCPSGSDADAASAAVEWFEIHGATYLDNGTGTTKQTRVLPDRDSYEAELAGYTGDAPQQLDFSQGQVLLVDMGQRNTGGYSIAVESVDEHDNYVRANVTLTQPGPSCSVTQALTNPFQFVFIATREEILVTEDLVIQEC